MCKIADCTTEEFTVSEFPQVLVSARVSVSPSHDIVSTKTTALFPKAECCTTPANGKQIAALVPAGPSGEIKTCSAVRVLNRSRDGAVGLALHTACLSMPERVSGTGLLSNCRAATNRRTSRSLHRLGLLEQSAIHLLLCSTTFMQQRTVPRTVRLLHLLMIDASKLKHIVTAASSKPSSSDL